MFWLLSPPFFFFSKCLNRKKEGAVIAFLFLFVKELLWKDWRVPRNNVWALYPSVSETEVSLLVLPGAAAGISVKAWPEAILSCSNSN